MDHNKIVLPIKRVSDLLPEDKLPFYASAGAAAMDLHAAIAKPLTMGPMGRAIVPTGIAIALPSPEFAAFVFARSGLAIKHGLALSNGVGVIDSDYRGEICVGLVNLSDQVYTIEPLERIAQMAILPVCLMAPTLCSELPETERGSGGFGSTGKK